MTGLRRTDWGRLLVWRAAGPPSRFDQARARTRPWNIQRSPALPSGAVTCLSRLSAAHALSFPRSSRDAARRREKRGRRPPGYGPSRARPGRLSPRHCRYRCTGPGSWRLFHSTVSAPLGTPGYVRSQISHSATGTPALVETCAGGTLLSCRSCPGSGAPAKWWARASLRDTSPCPLCKRWARTMTPPPDSYALCASGIFCFLLCCFLVLCLLLCCFVFFFLFFLFF